MRHACLAALVASTASACSVWDAVPVFVVAAVALVAFALLAWWWRRKAAAWIRRATVRSCELTPGVTASLSFAPAVGVEYMLRLDLDVEGATHSFDLSLAIQMDGRNFFDRSWPSGLASTVTASDMDDHDLIDWNGSVEQASSFNVMEFGWRWAAVHDVMKLVPTTDTPVTIQVRLTPTAETRVRRARALVTVGEVDF